MSIRKNPDATVGGSVLDAIGAQIEDLENVVSGVLLMKHPAASPWRSDGSLRIQGIDLLAIDWINVYDVPSALKTDAPVVRRSNGVVVPLADSVFDFYRFENSEAAYQDLNEPKLYTRMDLGVVSYNGVELLPSRPQSVWGPYDEIGLLIGCPRLPDEHRNTGSV
jgi:hypothetical protein